MKRIIFILSTALLLNHSVIQPQRYPLRKMLPIGTLVLISIYQVANIWTTSYFCAMPSDYHFKGEEIENMLYTSDCPLEHVFTRNVINKPAIVGALMSLFYLFKTFKDFKSDNKKFV